MALHIESDYIELTKRDATELVADPLTIPADLVEIAQQQAETYLIDHQEPVLAFLNRYHITPDKYAKMYPWWHKKQRAYARQVALQNEGMIDRFSQEPPIVLLQERKQFLSLALSLVDNSDLSGLRIKVDVSYANDIGVYLGVRADREDETIRRARQRFEETTQRATRESDLEALIIRASTKRRDRYLGYLTQVADHIQGR